ncbi:hypothetical protein Pan97_11610 [Bremerella volcania]|uniref:Uncharacterized protein n=1 Tax=Bremerella volcania TaxID=2527984 RepID=A0A518C4L3_9BACT|nr:hypothetical protein [Bremerella volcania]QDU74156.1 hypothetical protein Pan97_11610 [Bremerella volcania]
MTRISWLACWTVAAVAEMMMGGAKLGIAQEITTRDGRRPEAPDPLQEFAHLQQLKMAVPNCHINVEYPD